MFEVKKTVLTNSTTFLMDVVVIFMKMGKFINMLLGKIILWSGIG